MTGDGSCEEASNAFDGRCTVLAPDALEAYRYGQAYYLWTDPDEPDTAASCRRYASSCSTGFPATLRCEVHGAERLAELLTLDCACEIL